MEHESQSYTISDRCPRNKKQMKLRNWLNEIGIETQISELQKTVLLHTARILRKDS